MARAGTMTAEQHRKRGSYRRDRHGPLASTALDPKPSGKMAGATARGSSKWVRNVADERALSAGYRFCLPLAEHAEQFFRTMLKHSAGQWAGKPFELMPWQRDEIVYPLFGWVDPETGYRRFRKSYLEIPKKNGKSALASAFGLYFLVADGEGAAEVYSLGADVDQARVVHNEAINMVASSEQLGQILRVNRSSKAIHYDHTTSIYRALSSSPRGKHGLKPHAAIVDELHCWRGDELWESIRYAFRSRRQPFLFVITNAGDDLESVCSQQRDKAQSVIDGNFTDHRFLALIRNATREEAIEEMRAVKNGATELPVARKCNPSMDVIIQEDDLCSDVRDAIQTPREIPNMLRLTYGVWEVNSDPWLDYEKWTESEIDWDASWTDGRECWIGLDLAKVADTTAACVVYHDGDAYRIESHFWIPRGSVERYAHLIPYSEWEASGHVTVTRGDVCDYSVVLDGLRKIADHSAVNQILYDPYNAEHLMQSFEEQTGIERVVFAQTIKNFAEPTAEFERLLMNGQLHLRRNDCWRSQARNVTVWEDVNKNIRPIKPGKKERKKVDGIVAAIMGLGAAMKAPRDSDSSLLVFGGDYDE